jgi:hypothetical protein
MGPEQLYFIIGFLVGTILWGALTVALFILYHEWIKPANKDDDLFD